MDTDIYYIAGDDENKAPYNYGKPWTDEANAQLCELFDAGNSIEIICQQLHRNVNGVLLQLAKLNKVVCRYEDNRRTVYKLTFSQFVYNKEV